MEFHVALLQLLPGGTVQENLETGLNACRHPKKYGILPDEQIRLAARKRVKDRLFFVR